MIQMLFEQLTEKEQQLMRTYMRDNGATVDSSLTPCPLPHYLRYWEENKTNLFKLLDGQLIYQKRLNILKSKDMLADDLGQAIYNYGSAGNEFYDAFSTACWDYEEPCRNSWNRRTKFDDIRPRNEKAVAAFESRKASGRNLHALISTNALISNLYMGETVDIIGLDGETVYTLKTGCKVSKALGKIAKMWDLPGYENFRIAHSMVLNQKNFHGTLNLSIHPLDFMTMSDNNSNWSSCMSWMERGDYRMGTVEMMNSPYVVVAYLASDNKPLQIGYNESECWNNKKWRELFIVSDQIMIGVKGYPYFAEELEATTLKILRELAEKNLGWTQFPETLCKVSNNHYNQIEDRKIFVNLWANYMYNDLHSEHQAYVSDICDGRIEFSFSGPAVCVECGDVVDYSDAIDPSWLQCHNCCPYVRCEECGDWIHEDDACYLGDGTYCRYCFDEIATSCEICDEAVHIGDVENIHLVAGETTIATISTCYRCRERINRAFGVSYEEIGSTWSRRHILATHFEKVPREMYSTLIDWFVLSKEDLLKAISMAEDVPELSENELSELF